MSIGGRIGPRSRVLSFAAVVALSAAALGSAAQVSAQAPGPQDCATPAGTPCYVPAQLQRAYDLQPLLRAGLDGRGRTIVIVDSFGSPTIREDLHKFDQAFGLPDPPSLRIIEPAGAVAPYPVSGPVDPDKQIRAAVAFETTLNVEWSHAMAPGASIVLAATPVAETEGVQGFPEMIAAENYVIDQGLGDVISQSFGATEQTFPDPRSLLDLRSAYQSARRHRVTVLAGSGGSGVSNYFLDGSCCYRTRVTQWPSSDPLVTSVGGTQLHLDAAGNRTAPDNVWNDSDQSFGINDPFTLGSSGGGLSAIFPRPRFQDDVRRVVGSARGTPDVSMSAAAVGGVPVYHSFPDWTRTDPKTGLPRTGPQWTEGGSTGLSSPLFAGIVAIADQIAGKRLGWINPKLYRMGRHGQRAGLVDVTRGNNSFTFPDANGNAVTVAGYDAVPGYDMASGLGTIDAARFTVALAAMPDDLQDSSGSDTGT